MSNKRTAEYEEFVQYLENWGVSETRFKRLVAVAALGSGKKIVDSVKADPPFINRTGQLTSKQTVDLNSNTLELIFSNDAQSPKGAPYGFFLHDGTTKIEAMQWFPKGWERELPAFINKLTRDLGKEFEL